MKASIAIKSILASSFYRTGWSIRKLRQVSRCNFVILMYHSIIPLNEVGEAVQAGIYVQQDTFERHIRFLKSHFSIVPISELFSGKAGNSCITDNKPPCVLTFDDGWYDFYAYAFPILETHQVPATNFLPTDFIGTKDRFWTDKLGYLFAVRDNRVSLQKANRSSANCFVNQLEKLKGSRESRLEQAIAMLKGYRNEEINEILSELSVRWQLDPSQPGRAFISWEEVREMVRSGLITFGSHTVSHKILTTLTDDEIHDELMRSRERLIAEQAVDPLFIPFCYPNGNYNKKVVSMVRNAGYNLAVTTKKGWNHVDSDLFTLRRIGIHQDISSTDAMFACRILNLF